MTEEPRRSGRATKGIHNKLQNAPDAAGTKRTRGRGKQHKSPKLEASENEKEDDEEEEDDLIRCVCGDEEGDEEGRAMICCDTCSAWQHNDCMGLSAAEDYDDKKYFCEQCKPADHKALLAAMKRGEQPWEEVAARYKTARAAGKKGKKGKVGRPSKGAEIKNDDAPNTKLSATPTLADAPAKTESQGRKRKHEASPDGTNGDAQPAKVKRSSLQDVGEARVTKAPRRKSAIDPKVMAKSISEIPVDNRKGAATSLHKKVAESIRVLVKDGKFELPQDGTADSVAEDHVLRIEQAMFSNLCGDPPDYSGPYKMQLLTTIFNLGKNSDLLLSVLDGTVTADELSKMSSDDMATAELKQKTAVMKDQLLQQSTLVQDTGPRFRQTHKGMELIEDQVNQVTSDTITTPAIPRRRESNLEEDDAYSARMPTGATGPDMEAPSMQSPEGATPPAVARPLTVNTSAGLQSPGIHRRTSSNNFDIKNVWSSVQSPDGDQPRPLQKPPRRPSGTVQQLNNQGDDADIDRLLKDDDIDSPPYSPTEYDQDSSVIWRGVVDMPFPPESSIAKFQAVARHVAGSDLSTRAPLASIFPSIIQIGGRIEDKKADAYLTSLSAARSTDVTVLDLSLAGRGESAMRKEFEKLCSYFLDRHRYGVIGEKFNKDNVRDVYIVPLRAGTTEMPTFLQRLDHNIIDNPPTRNMLLVVFVLKWTDKQSTPVVGAPQALAQQASSTMSPSTAPTGASAMSPITRNDSAFSTTPQHAHFPFPSNPYNVPSTAPIPAQPHSFPPHPGTTNGGVQQEAVQILGHYYNAPVAQQILTAQDHHLSQQMLKNLRDIFERDPNTTTDFELFTRHLSGQAQAQT